MDFDAFMASNASRLESYIRRFARAFRLSGESLSDLRQEAHFAAYRALPYWRAIPGGKSAFNWCAGPMRRAMEKAVRREYGQKPCSSDAIRDRRAPYDDSKTGERLLGLSAGLDEIIDLKAALASDHNPGQIQRLLMSAFSPASGGALAKASGISRQSMWASNHRAKVRLMARMA
jgi:DNA-directed RNA polymerase specialized sigma24 family protein